MSGIPRTTMIKIASNKIPIVYLVIQDFQQIRYSLSFQLPLQLDILETHNLSMYLGIMLILTNGNFSVVASVVSMTFLQAAI